MFNPTATHSSKPPRNIEALREAVRKSEEELLAERIVEYSALPDKHRRAAVRANYSRGVTYVISELTKEQCEAWIMACDVFMIGKEDEEEIDITTDPYETIYANIMQLEKLLIAKPFNLVLLQEYMVKFKLYPDIPINTPIPNEYTSLSLPLIDDMIAEADAAARKADGGGRRRKHTKKHRKTRKGKSRKHRK